MAAAEDPPPEAGDVAADRAELRPGQGAFLDVVEPDEAHVLPDPHAGLREARQHPECHEIGEADHPLDLRVGRREG